MSHEAAIAVLTNAAETCENNAPINQEKGDWSQEDLEIANAQAYRKAIVLLQESAQ